MKHSIYILFLFLFFEGQAQLKTDSLESIWNDKNQADTIRLQALDQISGDLFFNTNADSALYYSQLQIDFAKKKGVRLYEARGLHTQGRIYFQKGEYLRSLDLNIRALSIRKKIKDKRGEASSLNGIANIYKDQGNDAKAMTYYTQSLKIREQIGDKYASAGSYNNIGNIYKEQGDYTKAIEYYTKSLRSFEEVKNEYGIKVAKSSLGEVYQLTGQNEKALLYLLDCIEYLKEHSDKRDESVGASFIGKAYTELKNYNKALEYLNRGLKIAEETDDKHCKAIAFSGLSKIYFEQGNYFKSIEYNEKALALAKKIGVISKTKDVSESLYKSYKKMGSYKEALEMHELYIQSRDSILSEKNQKEVMSQEFQYNYSKKALADSLDFISKKKINDLQHEAELTVEQNQRYALYSGLLLVIIFSIFIFNRFRVTSKQKKIIEYQQHKIVESINYSKKIQASLLPSVKSMQQSIDNLFIFYEPKDIVSGDFYWFKEFEKHIVLACADCTGHGVPGGFMSTLGNLLLEKVVTNELTDPAQILAKLSTEIIQVLHQQEGGEIQDGMDLSICLIDKQTKTIEFSGARNGIIVVANGVAKRYKADLFPVGGNYIKKDKPVERNFKNQTIAINTNDWIYMYTDGFIEQIGGTENLPMNYTLFENTLIELCNDLTAEKRIKTLETVMDNWRGENERDDDILILGFQIT